MAAHQLVSFRKHKPVLKAKGGCDGFVSVNTEKKIRLINNA
jgi:hypothetical protein